MLVQSTARIAGSALCSWGAGGDPGNPACDNVALPGFDLCPSHERISQYLERMAAQQPLSVRIDVGNMEHIYEEATAAGCAAVEVTDCFRPYGTYVFVVNGPESSLLPLLKEWGYSEGEYEVLDPCPFCGSTYQPCHTADGRLAQRPHAHKVPVTHDPDVCTANGTYMNCPTCQEHVPVKVTK